MTKNIKIESDWPWLGQIYNTYIKLINNKKLPKVLLIYGPEGSGKSGLAHELGRVILDGGIDAADIFIIDGTEQKITVDIIRDVIHHNAGQTALNQQINNKVFLLLNIHNITLSAANGLLKTLESDNNYDLSHNYFILTTSDCNKVLPTILSRCNKIQVNPVGWINNNKQQALNWFNISDSGLIGLLLKLANGGPLLALEYYKNNYIEIYNRLYEILAGLNNNVKAQQEIVLQIFSNLSNGGNIKEDTKRDTKETKSGFNSGLFFNMFMVALCSLQSNLNFSITTNMHNLINNYQQKVYSGIAIDASNMVFSLLYAVRCELKLFQPQIQMPISLEAQG